MTRHAFCPVCGGMDCGTACKHPRRSLTEAQREDLDGRPLRRARRERDEALAQRDELLAGDNATIERLTKERDEARLERDTFRAARDSNALELEVVMRERDGWIDAERQARMMRDDAERERDAAVAQRDALAKALRHVEGLRNDYDPLDPDATDWPDLADDMARIAREALAGLEEA